jgi:hypothetical protein
MGTLSTWVYAAISPHPKPFPEGEGDKNLSPFSLWEKFQGSGAVVGGLRTVNLSQMKRKSRIWVSAL